MENFALDLGSENLYTVSSKAVSRVLESRNPDAALLLLYCMKNQEQFSPVRAMKELSFDESRFAAAMDVLRDLLSPSSRQSAGLYRVGQAPADASAVRTPPSYTSQEIAEAMEDREFSYLYRHAEKAVGHPLRQYEVSSLMTIYDYLRLPANVIAMLISHVARESERRSTPERPYGVSFRDIKAEAARWYERGITTAAEAERFIEEQAQRQSLSGRVQRILGITGRQPSPTEGRYIDEFIGLDPSLELIALAYDLTVTKKGSLVWPYMRSILKRWSAKGYLTPEDVQEGEHRRRTPLYSQRGADTPGAEYDQQVLQFIQDTNSEGE